MNTGDDLSLVQGPSIITCMIVTLVSQLPHVLHQLSLQWV
jgi:ATP-dependent Lon protease